jgi:ketosteroid isomerase-like protein
MGGQADAVQQIADQVKEALEGADLADYAHLLDPDVHWGPPGDPSFGCRNRRQVLSWYQRGRDAGMRGRVTETIVCGDRILVGVRVTRAESAAEAVTETDRWQVLTVRGGKVVDIAGYDDRDEAAARAGLAPAPGRPSRSEPTG